MGRRSASCSQGREQERGAGCGDRSSHESLVIREGSLYRLEPRLLDAVVSGRPNIKKVGANLTKQGVISSNNGQLVEQAKGFVRSK